MEPQTRTPTINELNETMENLRRYRELNDKENQEQGEIGLLMAGPDNIAATLASKKQLSNTKAVDDDAGMTKLTEILAKKKAQSQAKDVNSDEKNKKGW